MNPFFILKKNLKEISCVQVERIRNDARKSLFLWAIVVIVSYCCWGLFGDLMLECWRYFLVNLSSESLFFESLIVS